MTKWTKVTQKNVVLIVTLCVLFHILTKKTSVHGGKRKTETLQLQIQKGKNERL